MGIMVNARTAFSLFFPAYPGRVRLVARGDRRHLHHWPPRVERRHAVHRRPDGPPGAARGVPHRARAHERRARARDARERALADPSDAGCARGGRHRVRRATWASPSSCRTGSSASAASRWGSPSPASAWARSCSCPGSSGSSVSIGWRGACWTLAALIVLIVLPLNLLVPGGARRSSVSAPTATGCPARRPAPPPSTSSTIGGPRSSGRSRAPCAPSRFWWIFLGYFTCLFAWYAVQIHQTKYLIELGFSAEFAAWALGVVGLTGIAGQILWGYVSDRIGREWAWTASGAGFALCYVALLALPAHPAKWLVYVMVAAQGFFGYGAASVFGAIPMELFQGARYSSIFAVLNLALERRRRDRALGRGPGARLHRELHAGVLDRDRLQRGVGRRDVAGGAPKGAARRRPRPAMSAAPATRTPSGIPGRGQSASAEAVTSAGTAPREWKRRANQCGMPKTAPHSIGRHRIAPSPIIVGRSTKKLYETISPSTGDSMSTWKFTLSTSQLPHAIPDARNAPAWKEPVNLVHCPAAGSEKFLATRGGNPRSSRRQQVPRRGRRRGTEYERRRHESDPTCATAAAQQAALRTYTTLLQVTGLDCRNTKTDRAGEGADHDGRFGAPP